MRLVSSPLVAPHCHRPGAARITSKLHRSMADAIARQTGKAPAKMPCLETTEHDTGRVSQIKCSHDATRLHGRGKPGGQHEDDRSHGISPRQGPARAACHLADLCRQRAATLCKHRGQVAFHRSHAGNRRPHGQRGRQKRRGEAKEHPQMRRAKIQRRLLQIPGFGCHRKPFGLYQGREVTDGQAGGLLPR